MKLTPENKVHIDKLSYQGLLSHWRFAAVGDAWFQGETGQYWSKRMSELRVADLQGAITASKTIGWDK